MGLRVHGESINLDEVCVESDCKKLLNKESVDVHMLYDFLARCKNKVTLEDYCRLYIGVPLSKSQGNNFPHFIYHCG